MLSENTALPIHNHPQSRPTPLEISLVSQKFLLSSRLLPARLSFFLFFLSCCVFSASRRLALRTFQLDDSSSSTTAYRLRRPRAHIQFQDRLSTRLRIAVLACCNAAFSPLLPCPSRRKPKKKR
ncbi:uncharacterized protein RHTO_03845 [Rhodotorula toruloides NP11]|uniref:Uncharacterized protein n=1 Tax=Rhodotorula toruloides (strain NP11) TaxID=1130832 RepID=M7WHT9_RHOT1|nr:uncharacterized protein RHTO_03845 [Rhodotorula toruloides NP11]EMS20047.1 hypothetical protein RHTO_03845 [Rhodotorula toruloides NP11]